jgi:hypothetical protein
MEKSKKTSNPAKRDLVYLTSYVGSIAKEMKDIYV